MVAITGVAAAVRGWRLGVPGRIVFDEVYYAQDACNLIRSEAFCGAAGPLSHDHPVLAKWFIAAGIQAFGYDPVGWRVAAVVFGIAGVALTYVLGRRLLGSSAAASLAAGLLALDGLHLVQSRVAMLDVFVGTLALASFLSLVIDRDRPRPAAGIQRVLDRPWLVVGGVAAGAATASKWSGAPFLIVGLVLVLVWDRRRGTHGSPRSFAAVLREDLAPLVVGFVAVPAIVYVVSFAGTVEGELLAAPWRRGSWGWEFLRWQKRTLVTGVSLDSTYPYLSPAWSWPLLKRPVVYALTDGAGVFREVLAFGNPALWWPAIAACAACLVWWVREGGGRTSPDGVILAGLLAGYLWWLPITSVRSFSFLFYMTPALPFLALAVARAAQRSWRWGVGRAGSAALVATVLALFVFFYPVWTAVPLDADRWTARLWFTDCRDDALTGSPPRPHLRYTTPPPVGWCWI